MRQDPHSCFDPNQGTITHADIKLVVDFDERIIRGSVKLFLTGRGRTHLDLDTRGLKIFSVTSGGQECNWFFRDEEPVAGTPLRIILPLDINTVVIEYETSKEASALQWLEPEQTLGKEQPFLYSQCQSIHARSIIPIQDSPGVRFTYTAEIRSPAHLTTVMAAKLIKTYEDEGYRISSFEMVFPIPAYLLAFAVGKIESRELSYRCSVYGEREIVDKAAWEFAELEDMLIEAERIFGPYPWIDCNLLILPPAFPYGGMENPTLIFLGPTVILGDRSKVAIIGHEIAHSWTGNLVTNETWEHFWLNEGFTMCAERKILESLYGSDRLALHETVGMKELTDTIEGFKYRPELTKLRTDLCGIHPDDVFSLVPYEKGSFFFRLLENTVGKARFMAFVRKYVEFFSFRSITSEKFVAFLMSELPDVANTINISEWIYGIGLPDNVPRINSLNATRAKILGLSWADHEKPRKEDVNSWSYLEWVICLENLSKIDPEVCMRLDEIFSLSQSKDVDILVSWFKLALRSDYDDVLPSIENFLSTIGRMHHLREVYVALCLTGRRDLAQEYFKKYSHLYHTTTRDHIMDRMQNLD